MSISEKNESVNTGRLEKKLKKIIFESKSRFCYRLRNEEYWQCASWKCIKAFYKVKKTACHDENYFIKTNCSIKISRYYLLGMQ